MSQHAEILITGRVATLAGHQGFGWEEGIALAGGRVLAVGGESDLEPLIGSRGRVAEVLGRKRNLSIEMIRRLHDRLGISVEVLIRPSRRDEAA